MSAENPNTLVHRFLLWEREQPDAVFLTEPTPAGEVVSYTWREVGDQARRMAAHLKSLDLPAGSSISIVGKNSAHWIIADVAIWLAGHVSVPLYPSINAETAGYVFGHCGVRLVFVGKLDDASAWERLAEVLPLGVPQIFLPLAPARADSLLWSELVARTEPLREVHLPDADELATVIYTSGSTGRPKGVMHSFRTIFEYARRSGEFCGFSNQDRVLSYLPLAHTAERSFVESNALCHGFQVFFNDSLASFTQDLLRARPTAFISMPRLWTKFYQGVCARLPREQQQVLSSDSAEAQSLKKQILSMLGLDATRVAFTGSAPLPQEVTNWYRSLGLELLDVYGMTENFSYSHYSRPGLVRLGYSGQAMPDVECRIAEDGEIQIKAPTMMLGYYRDPQQTAESLTADGFFRTGDRGELDEIGRLKITGRTKEIFKTSKGKYVAPAPIENKLGHPKVEATCVTGHGHPQPFAMLMLNADARQELHDGDKLELLREELSALRLRVNEQLEDHEQLEFLVVVEDGWTTENGLLTPSLKIRRPLIEDRYRASFKAWAELGLPVVVEGIDLPS